MRILILLLLAGCAGTVGIESRVPGAADDPLILYRAARVTEPWPELAERLSPELQRELAQYGSRWLTAADSARIADFQRWLAGNYYLSRQLPPTKPGRALRKRYQSLAGNTWYLRHILLEDSARAAWLHRALTAGASFDSLARRHSLDPGSVARGGTLPPTHLTETVYPFEQALLELAPGELSPPVATPFGWHLLRLDSLEVCDTPQVGRGEIEAHLRRALQQQSREAYLADLFQTHHVLIAGMMAAADAVAASWDARKGDLVQPQLWRLAEPGEAGREGRRRITAGQLEELLQDAFRGKLHEDYFDEGLKRDFLRHLLEEELLYRTAVAAGFCDEPLVCAALERQLLLTQAAAALRQLLPESESPAGDESPTEVQIWELLATTSRSRDNRSGQP